MPTVKRQGSAVPQEGLVIIPYFGMHSSMSIDIANMLVMFYSSSDDCYRPFSTSPNHSTVLATCLCDCCSSLYTCRYIAYRQFRTGHRNLSACMLALQGSSRSATPLDMGVRTLVRLGRP